MSGVDVAQGMLFVAWGAVLGLLVGVAVRAAKRWRQRRKRRHS